MSSSSFTKPSLPLSAGAGLKPQHFDFILENKPDIAWFEFHPENYMGDGGPMHNYLQEINKHYPLSMHGVGLSLGSADGIRPGHLAQLKNLVDRYQPTQVSEHLSWSHWNEIFLNDLLPLPYTQESMQIICHNIEKVQDALGRNILVENPSSYIDFRSSEYEEPIFLAELCKRTGCGLLLDVNNIAVSAFNNNFDPKAYLDDIPFDCVGEIHLAGHAVKPLIEGKNIRIDDHGSKVCEEVWELFEYLFKLHPKNLPLLIEWDTDIPDFHVLQGEADLANNKMHAATERHELAAG